MFVIEQPIPPAHAADSAANVLADWNAVYDAHNKELKSMFEKQAGVERFDLIQTFHACKQEEGKPVAAYVLQMKGYVDQLERLGYVLPQDLTVGLILNGLTKKFVGFVRNYNMHNMGKTIGELHVMLIEYEKGLPKKAETPQVMMIKSDKIQKANNKSLKAKGKGKANGKGKDKQVYIPKPKNPKPTAKEHPSLEKRLSKVENQGQSLQRESCSGGECNQVHHITPHREWFSNFEEHEEVVYTAEETPLATHGIGSVRLQNEDGIIVTLKGVRYSPKLKKNIISVGNLESKGFEVRAKDGVMKIISGVLIVMKGIRKINNTYHYKGRTVVGTVAVVTDGDRNSWHMRLGHAREKSLNLLIKQGLLKGLSSCKLDLCEHCINGKMTRVKFRTTIHKTQDNGGEYKNNIFTKFYKDEGIIRHFTVRHTPQQNGVAERMNQTLLEKVWCMLSNAGLGKEFWAEAVTYVCHLVNCLPSTVIDGKTPFEKWYGKHASDYDSLHVFGSVAYYHAKESKLDPRAKKALSMGINSEIKGYRLWCPETKKTIFSRDVIFNESAMLKKVNVEQLDGTPKKVEFERIIVPADRETDDNSPMVEGDYEEEEVQAEEPRQQQHESIATSKPKRNTKRPARLNDTVACASSIAGDDVPTTYSKAVRDSENEK
ncbi:retrovirus-related pol polyprotein from transposon TNT 1-94 [Tanacetum coccineum]